MSVETQPRTEAPRPIDRAYMDTSVRPGDDFFQYANGTWLKNTTIPDDETGWGGFAEVRDRNLTVLHEILEEAATRPGDLVGDLYASGMDEAGIERAGLASVADILRRADGLTDRSELPRLLGWLRRRGVNAALAVRVMPDAFNSRRNLVHLTQGGLGLPDRDYYLKDDPRSREIQDKYRAHLAAMFRLLGEDEGLSVSNAAAVYELERALATGQMPRVEQRDPYKVNNATTRAQLDEQARGFDWDAYLVEIGAPEVTDLNVRQPRYLGTLAQQVKDRPLDEWRMYLRARIINAFAQCLPKRFEDTRFDFYGRVLVGQAAQKPRWKRVLEIVDGELGDPLGRLYVAKAFPPEAKKRVLDLVADLRAVLRDRIDGLDWMGDETKSAARKKLDAFAVKMGYPDIWRDFSALTLGSGAYVDNVMKAQLFNFDYDIEKRKRPVDRHEWRMSPPTVNAYYNSSRNEIVFPAGILQPPFFYADADAAVNYGAIGSVIGHEMTHGFDDSGSQFDDVGNLRNWWTEDDRKTFTSRTDIVVKQFDEYEPLPGMHVNGKLCLGENIADLGGVRIAYAALERHIAREGEPAPIDGFTARQRFFLGYGQGGWRSKLRDEAQRVRLTVDPHSPGRYRVVGPLSNMPEFFDAFGRDGTAMERPKELRPTIW